MKDHQNKFKKKFPTIIAVSKTFSTDKFLPLVDSGHIDFGENKIQEAIEKWPVIKKKYPFIKLHMIGKLQTNKVKFAIPLFDYIHSLDNFKLAKKISEEQKKKNINTKIFIQINIGSEAQKSGISPSELPEFFTYCVNDLNLNIIGLMCLPPIDSEDNFYFLKMNELVKKIPKKELSMGMSNDYVSAYRSGSTFLRIGSKIFGSRN